MKNLIVVLVVLALLGGGYFYFSSRGLMPKAPGVMTGNNAGGNVFSSIKDALSKSLSLKCVYKSETGVETTSYIKAGSVRVMVAGTAYQEPNNTIMMGQKMYLWNDVDKTGFVYEIKKSAVTPGQTDQTNRQNVGKEEAILSQLEKYKNACKTAVVDDSFFKVPTDVSFQDFSKMMQQSGQ